MKRLTLLLLASFLSTSMVVQPMKRPRSGITETEGESDAKKMAISEIALNHEGYLTNMPRELLGTIFLFATKIDPKAPWKFLQWIHQLRKVCKNFNNVISHEETIAFWMNIPVMHVCAAKGNWAKIVELATKHEHRADRCIFYKDRFQLQPFDYAAVVKHGVEKNILSFNKTHTIDTLISLRNQNKITIEQANLFKCFKKYGLRVWGTINNSNTFKEKLHESLTFGGNVNCSVYDGIPLICLLVKYNLPELLEHLLEQTNKMGVGAVNTQSDTKTPLHLASSRGHFNCLKMLLNVPGIDVDAQTGCGRTALHLAAYGGHVKCMRELLKHVKDPNAKNNHLWTPLHDAANKSHSDCLQELCCVRGIDLDAKTYNDKTALHFAVIKGDEKAVKILVAYGANTRLKNHEGRTAADCARQNGHDNIVTLLEKSLMEVIV